MDSPALGAVPASLPEAREWLRKHFCADAARGLDVRYRFELSGDGGGVLSLHVDGGRLELLDAPLPTADVVYRLQADDFFGVLRGDRNPDLLFMEERIRIEGDLSLALKLRKLFSRAA